MRLKNLAAFLFLAPLAAQGAVIVTVEAPGVQTSQVAGVTTEDFEGFPLGNHTSLITAVGKLTSPDAIGYAIIPADVFGGAGGAGQYFVIGGPSGQHEADLDLGGPKQYLGLWLSALDPSNNIELYSSGSLVKAFNASTLAAAIGGNAAYYGNPNDGTNAGELYAYLNLIGTAGTTFDTVKFINPTNSGLEADNFSIREKAPDQNPGTEIPLPGAAVAGAALFGLVLSRKVLRMRKGA